MGYLNMLLDAKNSCLLVVDVQEKLIPFIHESERLIANCLWMMRVAQKLKIPILISEQYPKGLGLTVHQLRDLVTDKKFFMEKLHFSCTEDTKCLSKIRSLKRKQIVLIGIETHVCVLQTAIGLKEKGKEVFVVADAVGNRHPYDAELALARMREFGVQIISKEMALFEWMHRAGTEMFKQLNREFLR